MDRLRMALYALLLVFFTLRHSLAYFSWDQTPEACTCVGDSVDLIWEYTSNESISLKQWYIAKSSNQLIAQLFGTFVAQGSFAGRLNENLALGKGAVTLSNASSSDNGTYLLTIESKYTEDGYLIVADAPSDMPYFTNTSSNLTCNPPQNLGSPAVTTLLKVDGTEKSELTVTLKSGSTYQCCIKGVSVKCLSSVSVVDGTCTERELCVNETIDGISGNEKRWWYMFIWVASSKLNFVIHIIVIWKNKEATFTAELRLLKESRRLKRLMFVLLAASVMLIVIFVLYMCSVVGWILFLIFLVIVCVCIICGPALLIFMYYRKDHLPEIVKFSDIRRTKRKGQQMIRLKVESSRYPGNKYVWCDTSGKKLNENVISKRVFIDPKECDKDPTFEVHMFSKKGESFGKIHIPPQRKDDPGGITFSPKCACVRAPGDEVILTAKIENCSSDDIEYSWTRGNCQISTEQIFKATVENAGIYTVTASIGSKKDIYKGQVEVKVPPRKIEVSPKNISVFTGELIEMKAKADGYPMPTYRWTKDGKKIHGGPILMINSATSKCNGEYEVTASNELGNISEKVVVQVKGLLDQIIKFQPECLVITEKNKIDVKAYLDDKQIPFTWTWKTPYGDVIKGKKLVVDETELKHNGVYVVEAGTSNSAEKRIGKFSITVMREVNPGSTYCSHSDRTGSENKETNLKADAVRPKEIKVSRKNISVFTGELIEMKAEADGYPMPTYRWMKDGKKIHGGPILMINSATLKYNGEYEVTASNELGTISEKVVVQVKERVTFGNKPQIVRLGQTFEVTANLGTTNENGQIEYKEFTDCVWKNHYKEIKTSTLKFEEIQYEESGVYRVKTDNVNESTFTCEVFVQKPIPPTKIDLRPRSLCLYESELIKMTAFANGNPAPAYKWIKDSTCNQKNCSVCPQSDTENFGQTLQIDSAELCHSGIYRVEAKNGGGKVTGTVKVTVKKAIPPKRIIISPEKVINVKENQRIQIVAKADGNPSPKYEWKKIGCSHENHWDGSNLIIECVRFEDQGSYEVKAYNVEGFKCKRIKIIVENNGNGSTTQVREGPA